MSQHELVEVEILDIYQLQHGVCLAILLEVPSKIVKIA
jgi:hypothetical protein